MEFVDSSSLLLPGCVCGVKGWEGVLIRGCDRVISACVFQWHFVEGEYCEAMVGCLDLAVYVGLGCGVGGWGKGREGV